MSALLRIAAVAALALGLSTAPAAAQDDVAAEPHAPRLQQPQLLQADPAVRAQPTGLQLRPPGLLHDDSSGTDAIDVALDEALDEGFGDDDLFGQDVADEAVLAHHDGVVEDHGDADSHDDADSHGAGADHEDHGIDVMELAATFLNFAVWLALVVFFLRKPLGSYLSSRRRNVEEGLVEAAKLEKAAKAKHADYSERLAHLDEELEKLRGEMIQAGEVEADRIIAEAEETAARMRRDASFLIDQRMKQLRTDLTQEAIEAAVGAAERVLTEQVAGTDQTRLAEAYLTELAASMEEEVRA